MVVEGDKITDLTENTSPAATDIFEMTIDPAGTPLSRKVQAGNVGTTIFAAKDTDDLSEGSNLYYTEGRVTANSSVTANTAKTGVTTQISNVVEDTTPAFGGNCDWASNGMMLTSQTVAGSNGDAVYLSSADTWTQADASAESSASKGLGVRISATEVLTHGVYTTSSLTAGAIYYLSETTGAITTTAPTTSTSIVRIIGYALTTTELLVFPDQSFVENA